MKKTAQLRRLILSDSLEFLLEAHNGLSAKIAENAGFRGLWASGLSISASLGVRDANEASWTQVLELVEFINDAVSIPVLQDADTGYGNFNNIRRLVRKLEQRGVAGLCIEDKNFPKTNSFIDSESQGLASVDEFCGKLKAAKDVQRDDDFVVVARTESFVVGKSLRETLARAEAYRRAGADALLVHSKRQDCEEIRVFADEWAGRHPLIVVPTKYWRTPAAEFEAMGVSLVIWANHLMRAAAYGMQEVARTVFRERSVAGVEGKIASLREIFELQGVEELQAAEKKYLPKGAAKASRQAPEDLRRGLLDCVRPVQDRCGADARH